jgi:hypothetical protein
MGTKEQSEMILSKTSHVEYVLVLQIILLNARNVQILFVRNVYQINQISMIVKVSVCLDVGEWFIIL